MALPKRRSSRAKVRTRRQHWKATAVGHTTCPHCKAAILPHRFCPKCGRYRDRSVAPDRRDQK